MKKVIFKMDTIDTDTQKKYSAGSDAVEVSEAFAARIGKSASYGVGFAFEGDESDPIDVDKIVGDQSELREQIKNEFLEQFKTELEELDYEHASEIGQLKSDLAELQNSKDHEIEQRDKEINDLKSQLALATKTDGADAEKQAVKDEYELLLGNKPGNKSIDTMKSEIDAFKAESK